MLNARFQSLDEIDAMPIDQAREVTDREAPLMFGPVEEVGSVADRTIAGTIRARLYEPPSPPRGKLVYFHGGGWALGGLDSYDGVTRFICRHAGCTVIAVDYSLAPEHVFPAALEDAWASTRWAASNVPGPLAVGGDSSGGNLAAVVAHRARDSEVDLALQVLVYPALDLGLGSRWMRQYLGGHSAGDPDASPLRAANLAGIAPALILSCGLDELKPQADAYAARLQAAGVQVRHIVYPDLPHSAYRMLGVLPDARRMLEDSAAGLADVFAGR